METKIMTKKRFGSSIARNVGKLRTLAGRISPPRKTTKRKR